MKAPANLSLARRFHAAAASANASRSGWHARANFTSVARDGGANPEDSGDIQGPTVPQQRAELNQEDQTLPARSGAPTTRDTVTSNRPRTRLRKPDGSRALELFRSVVEDQLAGNHVAPSVRQPTKNLALYRNIARLQDLLAHPDTSPTTCFAFFESKIYPDLVQSDFHVPKLFKQQVGSSLMASLVQAWKKNAKVKKILPEVGHITRTWKDMGLLEPRSWGGLVIGLVQELAGIVADPKGYATIESYESSMARRDTLLQDLVRSWKIFSMPNLPSSIGGIEEFRLPLLNRSVLGKSANPRLSKPTFSLLFPQYQPSQLDEVILAAIATYVVLTDPHKNNPSVEHMASPLLTAMTKIMAANQMKLQEVWLRFHDYPSLAQYIKSRWRSVLSAVKDPSALDVVDQGPRIHSTARPLAGDSMHKRLDQALKSKNLQSVDQIWADFWGEAATPTGEKARELRDRLDLFNCFSMVYMALRQPNRAIHVWNSMMTVKLQPTVETWTSMLDGCKRARNAAGIKIVWNKLIASDTKLDNAVWTARVSGLIESGEPEAGLRALDELGRLWKNGKADDRSYVEPSIKPVNGALGALLRLNGVAAAKKVLAWAGQHGIEPDIYTYNTLLRLMIREGLTNEVDNIFQMMKRQGIRADVATFTIILESALGSLSSQTPQQQLDAVARILSEMEAAGVEANMQTFAKMIYLLLQEGDRAGMSVRAVLAHIWGKGLELSSHLYTILAEHYFSRDPPDLVAVRALIENRRLHDNKNIDRIFWERIIVGYCKVGDDTNAMAVFEKIDGTGAPVTLGTLERLLHALIRVGRLEDASRVVLAARRYGDSSYPDQAGGDAGTRFWRHHFWHLAQRHGLLPSEDAARFAAAATS